MTIVPDPYALDALMQQVLNCVATTLDDVAKVHDEYKAPKFRGLEWGPSPTMDLGKAECGELLVYLNNLYPSMKWPTQDQTLPNCAPTTLVADLSVRVTRCTPQLKNDGTPPTNAAKTAFVSPVTVDALGILTALRCCVPTANGAVRKRRVAITRTNPLQPSDVGGVVVTALISMDEACDCGTAVA